MVFYLIFADHLDVIDNKVSDIACDFVLWDIAKHNKRFPHKGDSIWSSGMCQTSHLYCSRHCVLMIRRLTPYVMFCLAANDYHQSRRCEI